MEEGEFEIRSEEVQDILSYIPNWIVRWGTTLIAGIFFLIIILTWIVKYPDTINGEITITTINPPIKLINKVNGKVVRLLKKDGELIKKGTIIAEIESSNTLYEIDQLQGIIDSIRNSLKYNLSYNIQSSKYSFGDIQSTFNDLEKHYKDLNTHTSNFYYKSRKDYLTKKINFYHELMKSTSSQIHYEEQELNNSKEKYQANKLLYQNGMISKFDFFEIESGYHQKLKQLEVAKSVFINSQITIADLQDTYLKEDIEQTEKERVLISNIEQSINTIKNYIDMWHQNNTVYTPIDGKLAYLLPLAANQFVSSSEPLFSIIPINNKYIGILQIESSGRGKILKGQKVIVKLDNYPYQEFGQVMAVVETVSDVPGTNGYMLNVSFPKGLKTSYNRELIYQPEMRGSAEIITNDLRLIERIANNIRGGLK